MRTLFTLLYITSFFFYSNAQYGWTQKTDLAGVHRIRAAGFSIGNFGFVGTGTNYYTYLGSSDFWKWNSATDTWTQVANVPGAGRVDAFGFSIGDKGYIGGGSNNTTFFNDLWEYDVNTNVWTQKANLGSGPTAKAAVFTIGNKGYVIAGNSLWEYDQPSDTWNQKANFPGVARIWAAGFSIGTKGYLVGGQTNDALNDFWMWDQQTNAWVQKPDFGGGPASGMAAFTLGAKAYVGIDNFWEWDEVRNSWVEVENLPPVGRYSQVPFTINGKGYVCTGGFIYQGPNLGQKQLWEYNPCAALQAPSATICLGQSHTITAVGSTNYTWSTSSTNSSIVVSPTVATVYTVSTTGINSCIKQKTISVTVNVEPNLSISPGNTIICSGKTLTLTASAAQQYTWTPYYWMADSAIVVTPDQSTTYTVKGSNDGCPEDTETISISVLPSPTLNVTGMEQILLCGQSTTLMANGAHNYLWNTSATTPSIVSTPSANTIYTLTGTNTNGCYENKEVYVFIYLCTDVDKSTMEISRTRIYPNPSTGQITLSGVEGSAISIYNIIGDKVILSKATSDELIIDLTREPNGIYVVKVTKEGEEYYSRIVKE